MTANFAWDSDSNPVGMTIDQMLYRVRSNDKESLVFDSLTMSEVIDDSDGVLAVFDALVTPYSRLERKVSQLQMVMDKAVLGINTISKQMSEPFKQNGNVQVAVIYELSDGQTVTVMFHNPDSTPTKLAASDEMISWKWMLNKKDITIVVAPENGKDLAVREVGRRIMKLALKNSAAFARINKKRAETLETIAALGTECESLEARLNQLNTEIEQAQSLKEQRDLEAANLANQKVMAKDELVKLLNADQWENTSNSDYLYKDIADGRVKLFFEENETIELVAGFKKGRGNKVVSLEFNATSDFEKINTALKELLDSIGVAEEKEPVKDLSLYSMPLPLYSVAKDLRDRFGFAVQDVKSDGHKVTLTAPRTGKNITVEYNGVGDVFDISSDYFSVNTVNTDTEYWGATSQDIEELDFSYANDGLLSEENFADDFKFYSAVESIQKGVNSADGLTVVFGDFNSTTSTQIGLFDSAVDNHILGLIKGTPVKGLTAQVGIVDTGVVLARISIDDKYNLNFYKGELGDQVVESDVVPKASYVTYHLNKMKKELEAVPELTLEEKLPELKKYLEQFGPLKKGQLLKSLSKPAYNDLGERVTVAQVVIDFANSEGARVEVLERTGKKALFNKQYVLSSKLGQIPTNFGVWLLESGTITPKEIDYPENFDPTTPENYQALKNADDLVKFQDRLDSFFNNRFMEVRNALFDLGWQGTGKDLVKNGYTAVSHFTNVGAGANVVGMHFTINDADGKDIGFYMSDTLVLTPVEYAGRVDMGLPNVIEPQPKDDDLNTQDFDDFIEQVNAFFPRSDKWSVHFSGQSISKKLDDSRDLLIEWKDGGELSVDFRISDEMGARKSIDATGTAAEFGQLLKTEADHFFDVVSAELGGTVTPAQLSRMIQSISDAVEDFNDGTEANKPALTIKVKNIIEVAESMLQRSFKDDTGYQKLNERIASAAAAINKDGGQNIEPVVDENMEYLKAVIANPENYTDEESLNKLGGYAEKIGEDLTSEFAQLVDKAVTLVQEVAFKQLQEMVAQG